MEKKKFQSVSIAALIVSILPLVALAPSLLHLSLSDGVRTAWAGANIVFVLLGLILSVVCVRSRESRRYTLVYRVINEILETEQSDITVAQAYLQIVLARCIGKLNLVEKSSVGSNDLIYQTVSYISANFKKKFSLEEMAKDLGVSKYVLSRLFSKTFHRNFNQYLNDARLNYACHRLENTSDSITNICLDSGFESQRTFNRVFKERYKISPSDYRSTCVKEMLS